MEAREERMSESAAGEPSAPSAAPLEAELDRLRKRLEALELLERDHTRDQQSLADALAQSRRLARESETLIRAARAVLEFKTFKPAAQAIFDCCKEMTGATSGYVALLSPEGDENEVLFLDAGGRPCTVDPELPMPIRGLRADAYRTGKAVYDNDFWHSQWMEFMPAGHVALDNVMFAPLPIDGRVVGLMGLANKPAPFNEDDARMATAFGELAAVALKNSRMLEALEDARLEAQSATRAKSQFLANMSHEIRTPMTSILGFADMLLDDEEAADVPPAWGDALETIRRNGKHLLQLIDDILDLSRIEADRIEIEASECSPADLVADVVAVIEPRARAKRLKLSTEWRGAMPRHIETDPLRLRQILINLLGNAVKFTASGSVRLVVESVQQEDGPAELRFDVIDTGPGIPADQQDKLFTPFTQADASISREHGGTGLGLAISRRLAEMLGGGISLTSSPGQGSTFSLTIPARSPARTPAITGHPIDESRPASQVDGTETEPSAQAAGPSPERADTPGQAGAARPASASAPSGNGERPKLAGSILLADDTDDNRRLFAMLLQNAGAQVSTADNGRDAHEQAMAAERAGSPFDVIIMDMKMPVVDGYEATRALRRDGYGGRIIALTAHAMEGDEEKCLAVGCDSYVSKPLDWPALLRQLAESMTSPG